MTVTTLALITYASEAHAAALSDINQRQAAAYLALTGEVYETTTTDIRPTNNQGNLLLRLENARYFIEDAVREHDKLTGLMLEALGVHSDPEVTEPVSTQSQEDPTETPMIFRRAALKEVNGDAVSPIVPVDPDDAGTLEDDLAASLAELSASERRGE